MPPLVWVGRTRQKKKRPEALASGLSHSNGHGLRDTSSDGYGSPVTALRLDHPFLEQLFVAQPQVRNVRRPEPQNILQRAAHFAQPEVHADLFE